MHPIRTLFALLLLAFCTALDAQQAAKAGRYRLQSNPWVNLHQRLMYEARFGAEPAQALAGDAWKKLVADYGAWLGKRSAIFNDELIRLNAELSETKGWELPASVPKKAAELLNAAMPLYRKLQWEEDDRANRFLIAMAAAMLEQSGEELVRAHEQAYGVAFPKDILVDVASYAWEFGAYTVGGDSFAHAVLAGTDPLNQGLNLLESLMHEPSHAIVDARSGAIGTELTRASQETGLKPMANLWHAILFYTSGELTRRALARRGITNYKPVITFMYDGPFRGYRPSLETHWQAALDGKGTREAAIKQILIETAPAKK